MSTENQEEAKNFDFTIFGDLMVEAADPNQRRMATKKEINELIDFIGGFEKWTILNEDCRMAVVEYLDYPSRCKLGFCSKTDYEVVNKTPLHIHSIDMLDNEKNHYQFTDEEFDNVVVRVQFTQDYNSGKRFELIFSQLGEDTQIQWMHYFQNKRPEPRNLILKSSNYHEEAVKFAEKWMKKGNFEIKALTVEMSKYPTETSQIKSLPRCKNVQIGGDTLELYRWWLQKVPEQIDDLDLITVNNDRETFTIPSDFLNEPQIMNVPRFYFRCRAAFTNEQFLNLKAKSMGFDCFTITDDSINQFLKKWVNGKGVDDFKRVLLWSTQERDQTVVLRGLQARPWDAEFEEEAGAFCDDYSRVCGRGTSFQITSRFDPYESLTISFHDDCIAIYATGKRAEWNGKVETYYSIP